MSVDLLRYFGAKFADGGRGPFEFDCLGLVIDIYRQRGIELPDWNTPPGAKAKCAAFAENTPQWQPVVSPRPWCVVAIAMDCRNVSHVGVVIDDRERFIHTLPEAGVALDLLKSPLWANRIRGFYEWPRQI